MIKEEMFIYQSVYMHFNVLLCAQEHKTIIYFLYCFVFYNMNTYSVQSLSHVRLCDTMNYSMAGLPVHHQLPEFTQTHVH